MTFICRIYKFIPIIIKTFFYHRYPTSIASLAFSPDGDVLAIASSFMNETVVDSAPAPDTVFIRNVTDQETKPKS